VIPYHHTLGGRRKKKKKKKKGKENEDRAMGGKKKKKSSGNEELSGYGPESKKKKEKGSAIELTGPGEEGKGGNKRGAGQRTTLSTHVEGMLMTCADVGGGDERNYQGCDASKCFCIGWGGRKEGAFDHCSPGVRFPPEGKRGKV